MIKLTAKKEKVKLELKGDVKEVAAEIAHTAFGMVERMIDIDKACGYACGWTLLEALEKILPEKPQIKKEGKEEDGEHAEG